MLGSSRPRRAFWILGAVLLIAGSSLAVGRNYCRFTVRDVTFVDLGDSAYELRLTGATEKLRGLHEIVPSVAARALLDTNVHYRKTQSEVTEGNPVLELRIEGIEAPLAIAVDPNLIERELGAVLDAIIHSEARSVLNRELYRTFCQVVFVEGPDGEANTRIEGAVDEAIEELSTVFDQMPKDVGALPGTVRIAWKDREAERVLLWSLGVDAASNEPALAMVIGCGRLFGAPLFGDAIDKEAVFGLLALMGQSCECDLDRSWMRGRRLPLRRDRTLRDQTTTRLGFDPESPMVLAEVGRLLTRGPSSSDAEGSSSEPSIEELLLGYSEVEVAPFEAPPEDPEGEASTDGDPFVETPSEEDSEGEPESKSAVDMTDTPRTSPPSSSSSSQEDASPFALLIKTAIGLLAICGLGIGWMVMRSRSAR